jgi:hypothetical protein
MCTASVARTAQQVEPQRDVSLRLVARDAERVTLAKQCGEIAGQRTQSLFGRAHDHVRESRVHAEARHLPAVGSDAAILIHGLELR